MLTALSKPSLLCTYQNGIFKNYAMCFMHLEKQALSLLIYVWYIWYQYNWYCITQKFTSVFSLYSVWLINHTEHSRDVSAFFFPTPMPTVSQEFHIVAGQCKTVLISQAICWGKYPSWVFSWQDIQAIHSMLNWNELLQCHGISTENNQCYIK